MSFDNDFDSIEMFNNNFEIVNIINNNIPENYIKEIYENIKDEINYLISIELVNDNIIFIYFKINHIIDYCTIAVTFNPIINKYVLSLILYHNSTRKMKKIDKKIIDSRNDSIRILNNISTISDYILVDFFFINFN